MGSVEFFEFWTAVLSASPEKIVPLTAMIFWPGASLALSAGPPQRTSEMTPSVLTRRPMEYQKLPERLPPAA